MVSTTEQESNNDQPKEATVQEEQNEPKNELENYVVGKEQQKQKTSNELLYLDPEELKPHPVNVELYGREDIDESQLESIRDIGQIAPMEINQFNDVIGGHRRLKILLYLKREEDFKKNEGQVYKEIKAVCIRKHYKDLLEEKEAIVELNRSRIKNPFQIYNEIELLEDIYSERAEQRKLGNLPNLDVPDLGHREKHNLTALKKQRLQVLA